MRWLVRVAFSLLLLALLAVAALFLVPTETVGRLASAQIERLTGRAVAIEGGLRPTVWPQIGVRTGPVTLQNAPWSRAGPMLRADALDLSIDAAALFGGTVRVTGLKLTAPEILLERAADGSVNWDLTAPAPAGEDAVAGSDGAPPAPQQAPTPFSIDRAEILGGTLRYLDHGSGDSLTVTALALEATVPDFQGQADLRAAAVINGQAATLAGTVNGLAAFLAGSVRPATLAGTLAGAEVSFDGRLGLSPMAGEGKLDLTLRDVPAIFALLGRAAPGLPAGLGRDRIAISGMATLTSKGSAHLRDGAITLDNNRLAGAFDLVPGSERPMLTAQLTAGALDLSAPGGGAGGSAGTGAASAPAPAAGGWSTVPIVASGLGAADAVVSFAADSVDLGSVAFGQTRASVTVDAARAVVDLHEVAAYGGTLAGQVIINARKGLSARVNLSMTALALQPLLSALAGTDRLTGSGDLRMNLLGSGSSQDALMRSLEGEASLALRDGELRGLDLAGMIRTLDAGYVGEGATTVFDSITASFAVAGGVARNSDMALTAPLVTAAGAGQADIGGQTLDLRITPLTLGGQALHPDVQVPVLISGPWAALKVRLDLESLAKRKFEEERQKLEERARAEIGQKLQEETGIVPQAGESLEDTAQRAAEEFLQKEAEKALERLLGGGSGE
jgi:AsmA protein